MTKKGDSELVVRIKELEEELRHLENARDAIQELMWALENADCEFGNCNIGYGAVSHHAEMEIGDTLSMVEERINEIERKVAYL